MPENCDNSCPSLTRLEQQVDDIRRQNGNDHKEFREEIADIRQREARQEGKLDYITGSINELKVEVKEINGKMTTAMNKVDDVDKLNKDMEELKGKSGKRWDGVVEKLILMIVSAVALFLLAKIGL